jgi:small GTP-binding protein
MKPDPVRMKIVVIGSENVGKTSLIQRYISEGQPELPTSTLSIAFSQKKKVIGSQVVHLTICDTAGQERYQSVSANFYRDAQGALAVFDVTSPRSLDRARTWLDELRATMPADFLICIAANKIDEVQKRAVTTNDGKAFAAENGALYQETSAITGDGVEAAFGALCEEFVKLDNPREAQVVPAPLNIAAPAQRRMDGECC